MLRYVWCVLGLLLAGCNQNLVKAPQIERFVATPNQIEAGGATTLEWLVQRGEQLHLEPGSVDVSGQTKLSVSPSNSITYTLVATNAMGKVSTQATVMVKATPPKIKSFKANPLKVQAGEPADLSWELERAEAMWLEPGHIELTGKDSYQVKPTATTTYTLVATNGAGKTEAQVEISVEEAKEKGPRVKHFTALPSEVDAGQKVKLSWELEDPVKELWLEPGHLDLSSLAEIELNPISSITYTLVAVGQHGKSEAKTMVKVRPPQPTPPAPIPPPAPNPPPAPVPAPELILSNFIATPVSITVGSSTRLSWKTTGATQLILSPGGLDVSGKTELSVSPSTTTTYVLRASNATKHIEAQTTVNVVPPVPPPPVKSPQALAFKREVLDANPPSGTGCCLDVLALGDIDGDGKIDAAIGSEHGGGWYWYHNNGSAANWPRYKIGEGDFTTDGRLADINGDGRLDFVVSSINRDEIEWWENKGNPTQPSNWLRHSIGGQFAHDVVVGDLSGDGRADVVMFRKDNPAGLSWAEQPSDPTKPWTIRSIAAFKAEGLTLGDVDSDGDLDIVASRYLFKNADGKGGQWVKSNLSGVCRQGNPDDIRPAIADINQDSKPDIVLAPAEECVGPVVWLEGPHWNPHPVEVPDKGDLLGNHTLEVSDFDGDGRPDLLVGEMHSGTRRVMVYQNLGKGEQWQRYLLSSSGTHNARIADVNSDGFPDVVGKNYDGAKQLEVWYGQPGGNVPVPTLSLDEWTYKQVDASRERFKGDLAYVGLAFGDINRDGFSDMVSGKYFYRNPGGNLMNNWSRIAFPQNLEAMFVLDVDGDGQQDVVAQNLPKLFWLKPDATGNNWTLLEVASGLEPTEHVNSQGYAQAQIRPGGLPELIFTTGAGLWYVEIPANPTLSWTKVQITSEPTTEDVLAVGDVDGDGDQDVVGSLAPSGHDLYWFENPGGGASNWVKRSIGSTIHWADRSTLADLNGDGRLDLVVSDENGDGEGAGTFWFENPGNLSSWTRRTVATQGSTNAMSVADMDGDGDPDIITGEHKGQKRLTIWENQNKATNWIAHQVDAGKESHLGARAVDLDNDGDQDIVSIAWDSANVLHLWRNDAKP